VPLGRGYLELVTVVEQDVASRSAFGRAVLSSIERDGGLAGWAVRVDDLEEDARRLGLQITSGERARPDGQTLRWRLAGVEEALSTGALPFFIEWDGPAEWHPGRAAADHAVDVRGLARVDIAADGAELGSWLGEHELPLRIVDGPPGISAVGIATGAGELNLETVAP
jgi:Glyoxalase-like domain